MNCARIVSIAAATAFAFLGMSAQAAEPLKFAVTDVEGLERLQVEWGPFKDALEKASGLKFAFFPVNSRTAAAEALKAKRVDFVLTGPAEYVVMNKMTSAKPLMGFGRPDYYCAIIAMAKSGIHSVQQLKGKKVALSDVGSTSGHLCPMQLMADYKLDPMKDLSRVHVSRNVAHESLKRGDVAAIGYNHNTWVDLARNKDTLPPGAFRMIARSGDLPNDVLIVAAHVDAAIADKLKKSILENEESIVKGIVSHPENGKFKGMAFSAISDADYNVVRSMYATIGYPQYSEFVGN